MKKQTGLIEARGTHGFLWFMLLSAIGLNVYLGWISRGFYVRYGELADELKDTFSTSHLMACYRFTFVIAGKFDLYRKCLE